MSPTSGGARCGVAATRIGHLGTDDEAGGRLAPKTDHPPSLAQRSLCRHAPEVGAVCGKAARTDLCGGRAMKSASLPLPAQREGEGTLWENPAAPTALVRAHGPSPFPARPSL